MLTGATESRVAEAMKNGLKLSKCDLCWTWKAARIPLESAHNTDSPKNGTLSEVGIQKQNLELEQEAAPTNMK